jgi:phosphoserine aminotransferase
MENMKNFYPGPGKLPPIVLKFAQENLSIMELGHRQPRIEQLIDDCKNLIQSLLNINDTHEIIFLQGGASLQFLMVPMNFSHENEWVSYVDTGYWSKKAIAEAKHSNHMIEVIPDYIKNFHKTSAFLHICSNNTVVGTQWHTFPETNIPLIADMSSDLMSREIDVSKFGCIYAHAQKNMGTAGVTAVIIRKDMLDRIPGNLPAILDYRKHIEANSLYHTPPVWSIYIMWRVLLWLRDDIGGIAKMEKINNLKAKKLYDCIDSSTLFECPIESEIRSKMNVVFTLPLDLTKKFLSEAEYNGFAGLRGHRHIGGLRASIYNPVTYQDVVDLTDFMQEFERVR